MKVALLCNDDLTTNLIFSPVFETNGVEVAGLFISATYNKSSRSLVGGSLALMKKMSFRYWVYLVITNGLYKVFDQAAVHLRLRPRNGPLVSLCALAERRDILHARVQNFDLPEFIEQIRKLDVDLLLIRVGSILSAELLNVPRNGTWCVHSSLLPSFKGIAGEFHAIRTPGARIGSTIFEVTPKIDEGPPIAQIEIERDEERSVFDHMIRNNRAASRLLVKLLKDRLNGRHNAPQLLNDGLANSYFSWPNAEHMRDFKRRRGCLIRVKEIMLLITATLCL